VQSLLVVYPFPLANDPPSFCRPPANCRSALLIERKALSFESAVNFPNYSSHYPHSSERSSNFENSLDFFFFSSPMRNPPFLKYFFLADAAILLWRSSLYPLGRNLFHFFSELLPLTANLSSASSSPPPQVLPDREEHSGPASCLFHCFFPRPNGSKFPDRTPFQEKESLLIFFPHSNLGRSPAVSGRPPFSFYS